jgi:single-strand DNA-binding protein
MANLNKVMLIGRLTRDPEVRTFSTGGKVTAFGFAVTGTRKKNAQTGQWENEPCFLDIKAFNSGYENGRKLADLCEQYLHKGDQAYIEGHLVLEQWEKDGQKRSAVKVILDGVEFLQPKAQGGMNDGSGMSRPAAARQPANNAPSSNGSDYYEEPAHVDPPAERDQEIPF